MAENYITGLRTSFYEHKLKYKLVFQIISVFYLFSMALISATHHNYNTNNSMPMLLSSVFLSCTWNLGANRPGEPEQLSLRPLRAWRHSAASYSGQVQEAPATYLRKEKYPIIISEGNISEGNIHYMTQSPSPVSFPACSLCLGKIRVYSCSPSVSTLSSVSIFPHICHSGLPFA